MSNVTLSTLTKKAEAICSAIDKFSELSGKLVSWLVLLMVLIIVYDVSMRYLFRIGSVGLQELEWHLFSVLFLLGAAYTLKHDGHVRVDVFFNSRKCSDYCRAWINLAGFLLLLLPFSLLIINSSTVFVLNAFVIGEGSPDPGGLPYRFVLKAMMPLGFALLIVQGLSHFLSNVVFVLRHHTASIGPR